MTIYKKLKILQETIRVKKDRSLYNGKSYRNVEDILEAIRKEEHDFTVLFTDDVVLLGDRFYVKSTCTLVDADGSSVSAVGWAREPMNMASMQSPQVTGSCSTYARRYAISSLLALGSGEQEAEEVQADDPMVIVDKIKAQFVSSNDYSSMDVSEIISVSQNSINEMMKNGRKEDLVSELLNLSNAVKQEADKKGIQDYLNGKLASQKGKVDQAFNDVVTTIYNKIITKIKESK